MAKSEIRKPTLRKFLSGAAFAALLLFAASASAHHISATWHGAQQGNGQANAQANEVSGKVIAIAPDKKSISLEVTNNNSPSTMQFAIDDSTRVTGRVSVGTHGQHPIRKFRQRQTRSPQHFAQGPNPVAHSIVVENEASPNAQRAGQIPPRATQKTGRCAAIPHSESWAAIPS